MGAGLLFSAFVEADEIFVLFFLGVGGLIGWAFTSPSMAHPLVARHPACVGLARLAVLLSLAWMAYVLWNHADASVTLIYKGFYLAIGLSIVLALGRGGAQWMGARLREDVLERGNWAAALWHAAFVLATGMIYGGSLWGDADALGDDEGGWWIPLGFFLGGWAVLLLSLGIYRKQEPGFLRAIRQDRDWRAGMAAAGYTLSAAWVITNAVAGDFYGWWHGLLPLGALAGMALVHWVFSLVVLSRGAEKVPRPTRRFFETAAYVVFAMASWGANRYVNHMVQGMESVGP
jgi:hypothetical protein